MSTNLICKKASAEFLKDYTVLDIETTGLSYHTDEIIEISGLKVRNNAITDEFNTLLNPSKTIGGFITYLTGITNDMVKNAPKIEEILPDFVKFIGSDVILGHNVRFDLNFIQENLENCGFNRINNSYIDTMILARRYCKLKSHSLKNLAQHYEVNIAGHHRALNDCRITHEIYNKLKNEFMTLQI